MGMPIEMTRNRPVTGTLIVRYPNGDEEAVTGEMLAEIGFIPNAAAYARFSDWLNAYLGDEPQGWINTIRYAVECATAYYGLGDEHMPDVTDPGDVTDGRRMRDLARATNQGMEV